MLAIRMTFEKLGSARYISHLDLMRCFERCIRRAEVPIWYTEGFNPRPFLTFSLPLSLGYGSVCETVDLKLTEDMSLDEVRERINRCLPEGLRITEVFEPEKKPTAIVSSRYEITLTSPGLAADELCSRLSSFLSRESIVITKLNKKKKPVESDIRPLIKAFDVKVNDDGTVLLNVILASGCTESCNPSLPLSAFAEQTGAVEPEYAVLRTCVLCADGSAFR